MLYSRASAVLSRGRYFNRAAGSRSFFKGTSAQFDDGPTKFKDPVNVVVTGGTGSIGYNLLFRIASGSMLGPDQPINLSIHSRDRPGAMEALTGVRMELNDSWFPLLQTTKIGTNLDEAFADADIACFVGSVPRGPGMERADLLKQNGKIFVEQGKALDRSAKKTCRTVVVGNPANTNALIAMSQCKNIPPENFSALTRLDHNRLVFQIARKAGVHPTRVQRACIWGNHSPTMYPDIRFCEIDGKPIFDVIDDHEWLCGELVAKVQQRGRTIIEHRQQSSSASAASATADHIRDWLAKCFSRFHCSKYFWNGSNFDLLEF